MLILNNDFKTVFTKVLEVLKEIKEDTEDPDTYTEAFIAQKELEVSKEYKDNVAKLARNLPSNITNQLGRQLSLTTLPICHLKRKPRS